MIDLRSYRWWTFAKSEDDARQIIRQTRERNAVLGLAADTWLAHINA